MFCAKARETVREAFVVGEVPQTRVQETSLSQGQCPLLRNNNIALCNSAGGSSLTKVKLRA